MLFDTFEPAAVDAEAAREFLLQATRLASSADLEDLGQRLEHKSRVFQRKLGKDQVQRLEAEDLRRLVGMVFGLRRFTKPLLAQLPPQALREAVAELIHGAGSAAQRLEAFVQRLPGMDQAAAVTLASELLHYTHPGDCWLWAPWMWHAGTNGGALPLVLQQGQRLAGNGVAEHYEQVGRALAAVSAMGSREGFTRLGAGLFGTHAFLACVYAVYMYTVFRIKLSQEFN
ncbi:MAG TPA: hypothetical protein VL359_13590, partial [bacterium]|nr:hypothetical protein [bacterium]